MKISQRLLAFFVCLTLIFPIGISAVSASAGESYQVAIVNLKTNGRVCPMEVDTETPTFSWSMDSNLIGQKQTAYQIVVRSCGEDDAVVWDSGKIKDDRSVGIAYQGADLMPGEAYCWQVTAYDRNDRGVTSETSVFQTGLMSESIEAWKDDQGRTAQWIGAPELAVKAKDVLAYTLEYGLSVSESGDYAGIVFGANDPRLSDPTMNAFDISGENYFALVLDVSQTPAQVKIMRKGYLPADADNGRTIIASADLPEELVNDENKHLEHKIRLSVTSSGTSDLVGTVQVDGASVLTNVKLMQDNPLVTYFSASPRLNEIGFLTAAGTTAQVNDFRVIQSQHGINSVLFSQNTGATYRIFEGLDGVSVNGGGITAAGAGDERAVYADPSFSGVPMLRKKTSLENEVAQAKLYVTARGVYEFFVNGQRIGEDWFNPGYTQYDDFMTYSSYDVTDQLTQGENVLGAWMSSGWWSDSQSFFASHYNYWGGQPALLAKLDITYADGTKETILTDDSWVYSGDGPIVYSGMLDGEDYDATKEAAVNGWNAPGFDDSSWKPVDTDLPVSSNATENPRIVAKVDDPVQVAEVIDSTQVEGYPYEGQHVYAYDMGTNMVGVPQIKLPEMPAGRVITLRYSEYLYPELAQESPNYWENQTGVIVAENLFYAMATDTYITKGTPGGEVIQPHFTFHGYQYLEIHGLDEALPAENVKGLSLSSISEQTAQYESSNELTNQLFDNIMRSAYGNHLSIPTDCPQRAERMGWTGDAMVFSRTATYLGDIDNFYRNWAQSLRSVQSDANGTYPQTVPATGYFGRVKNVEEVCWPGASLMICWESYRQYGDVSFVAEHFESMKQFLDGLNNNLMSGKSYLTSGSGLADHLALVSTDASLCSNVFYAYYTYAFSEMAKAIGEDTVAEEYRVRYQGIRTEWNDTFLDPVTGKTISADGAIQDTQTSYALPIAYGVIADSKLRCTGELLEEACKKGYQDEEYTINTGFVGTAPLLPALTLSGNNDAAYTMFTQTNYPSWLYPVTQGATSMWERWDIIAPDVGFDGGITNASSFNHYAYGAIGEWMINYHIGISDNAGGGFQNFVLQPTPGGEFTFVNGSYDSNYGSIESNWTAEGGELISYEAVVPANTCAILYLPVSAETVGDFKNIDGVTFLGMEEHNTQTTAKFRVQAGGFSFAVTDGKLAVSTGKGYVSDDTVSKSILRSVLAYAETAYESDEFDNVIDSVQESFIACLEHAREVDADIDADQKTVDEAWKSLMTEIHKLGFVRGDKAYLEQLIETAGEFSDTIDRYTPSTASPFTQALTAAKTTLDDGNAMQDEVTKAADALFEAMLKLRYRADKSVLEEVLEKAAKVDTTLYTEQSVAAFQRANEAAKAVYDNPEASKTEVSDAAEELRDAMKSLKAVNPAGAVAVQGDKTTTAAGGNAKTGESAPAAAAVWIIALAGIGLALSKKKK